MCNLFDKENRNIIKTMNTHMGTKHRTKPYELNNPNDLKHALMMAVAAYRDYNHYRLTLFGLIENFDESLEIYDTISWFNMGYEPEKSDSLSMECADAIGFASSKFDKITTRAREHFAKMLYIVLSAQPETQKAILGRAYDITSQDMDKKIESLIELLDDTEYQYANQDNLDTLVEIMAEEWFSIK